MLELAALLAAYEPLLQDDKRVLRALGVKVEEQPTRKTIVLGRGRTHAGVRFEVSEYSPRRAERGGCSLEVNVSFGAAGSTSGDGILQSLGGEGTCVAGRSADTSPRLECEGADLTIVAAVSPRLRSVSLRLADGRSIVSRVVPIGRRHGGPAAVYVQELPRGSSRPVALIELGSGGAVVAEETVARVPRCRQEALGLDLQPTTLVSATTPTGAPFTIATYGTQVTSDARSEPLLELRPAPAPESTGDGLFEGSLPHGPFDRELAVECPPQGWTVVYGLLRSPGASVSAVTPAGEVPLTLVAVPRSLRWRGVLAYGAFAQMPERLIVRDRAEQVLQSEDLTRLGSEHAEFCEGYAEPG